MSTFLGRRISLQELRDHTCRVVRRAAAGESFEITVSGEPVARLAPLGARRPYWTPKEKILERLGSAQADPGLHDDLRNLADDVRP